MHLLRLIEDYEDKLKEVRWVVSERRKTCDPIHQLVFVAQDSCRSNCVLCGSNLIINPRQHELLRFHIPVSADFIALLRGREFGLATPSELATALEPILHLDPVNQHLIEILESEGLTSQLTILGATS